MYQDLITVTNIDRKRVAFRRGTRYEADADNFFFLPAVIIVKNEAGRALFNELMRRIDYREKNAHPIPASVAYPYYVLCMSFITMSCHFGLWEHYESLDDLAQEVSIEEGQDDFAEFAEELLRALS